jgi:hypothetical protein
MRGGWERLVALGAVALAALVVTTGVAATPMTEAAPTAGPTVAGTPQGASQWSPVVESCSSEPASAFTISGTFDASFIGRGTYSGQISRTSAGECPFSFEGGPPFAVGGTVTFTGPGGSFVATIAEGSTGAASESPHATEYDFDLLLTITSGTRRYARVGGDLTLSYETDVDFASPCACPSDHGTLGGSVALGAGSAT